MIAADEKPAENPPASPASMREALRIAAGVTLATAMAVTYVFSPDQAGTPRILLAMGSLYVALTAAALIRLHKRGELRAQMLPRGGDLSLGAFVALLLYGAGMAGHLLLTGRGSPREGWVMRIYLQIGDPSDQSLHLTSAGVFVVAALEEIVWRGLVMRSLESALGSQRAWLISTALFALAHVGTCYLLRDPSAGFNPMLVGAALGCGLVWGHLARRTGRLVPSIFAHALFSWSVIEFPIWRP